jgi:carboxypeptidase C (cathepsin A)
MGLDESVRKNVRMEYYDAGHMMYVHKPSLERLAADLREFVNDTR